MRLAILGAGGHGRVVASVAESTGDWKEIVFYDSAYPEFKQSGNWSVLGGVEDLLNAIDEQQGVIVALGDNDLRNELFAKLNEVSANIVNIVHPSAVIAPDVILGRGITIMPNAVVNTGASIASGAIINTAAIVEHDCHVGLMAHLSPSSVMAGGSHIGDFSWLGAGAVVIQSIRVCNCVNIGAGSVVLNDLKSNGTYVGTPARRVRAT